MNSLSAASLTLLTLGGTLFAASEKGPGISKITYKTEELYKPLGSLKSSKKNSRGHAAMQMFNGYLMGLEARDSGLGDGAIAFWDISDPKNPKRVATHADERTKILFEGHNYGFTELDGKEIVFMNAQKGLQIWDWSNIKEPQHISSLDIPGLTKGAYANTIWWLAMQYPYVYMGGTNTGIHIIDATDLDHPKLVKSIPMSKLGGFKVGSLFTCGNLLVANSFDGPGISALDISDPLNPKLIKTLKEKFGYSMLFNGGYLYGIAEKPLVWDVREPSKMRLISSYKGERLGSKGGYGVFQDGFLHQGASNGYAKIDVRDPKNPKLVKRVSMRIPKQDFDGANVIGNYVVMTCDHGTGSHIIAHTEEPDTNGPEVNFVSPADQSKNNHLLSRIGLTFTDEVDHHDLDKIMIRPVGGNAIKGHWSLHNAILNFFPVAPLERATTYEIIVPEGSVKDQVGNPITKPFRSSFSTGNSISDFKAEIAAAPRSPFGNPITFKAIKHKEDAEYAWDFGDGTPLTAFKKHNTIKHVYQAPGRYTVILHVRKGSNSATAQSSHTAYLPNTQEKPGNSATIAIVDKAGGNAAQIWNVNPDNDTVTVTASATMQLLKEFKVAKNPRTLSARGQTVASVSQDLATLALFDARSLKHKKSIALKPNSQPFGVVLNHDATKAYVTSQALGEVYEIDCVSGKLLRTFRSAHMNNLRGIAIDAENKHLYVTRFISRDKQGDIFKITLSNGEIANIPLQIDTSLDTEDSGRGLPNYLTSITISPDGSNAWIPSKKDNIQRGLARDGKALTFESTVRPIASKIDLHTSKEIYACRHDFNDKEGPIAATYSPDGDLVFIALQGTNSIEVIDAYTGTQVTSILDVGSAPQGLVIDPTTNRLYVHAFLDRSIAAYDVSDIIEGGGFATKAGETKTVTKETLHPYVLKGKKLFYHAGNPQMSRDSYISCASCHQDGGHDGRTWDFTDRGEGLRNTTTLLGKSGEGHGPLHWSANFDEINDFEHDIRNAFGGTGLIVSKSTTVSQFNQLHHPLGFPKSGMSKDLDALATYVRSLSATPASPHKQAGKLTESAVRGEKIFRRLDCASCHSGQEYTDSTQFRVHNVGTLTKLSGKRLGGKLKGIDTPTLKGIWATAPYLHDGSAKTLRDVLTGKNQNDLHGKTSKLSDAELDDLVAYLSQIDDDSANIQMASTASDKQTTPIITHNQLASSIIKAIETKQAVAPITTQAGREIGMEEAYKIQTVFDQYMQRKYGKPVGYKMAYASEASQKKWGIPAPVSGTFFEKQHVKSGGSVRADSFLGFHIESEIAFIIKKDIKRPIKDLKKINDYIKSVHVGLDVPDLRYDKSKGKVLVADVIGMSCGTHTYVLGKGVDPRKVDFQKMKVALTRDGKEVYAGQASNVMGDPRESLRQLANRLIKAGTPLKRDQFVLTGSVTGAYFPKEKEARPGHYVGTATGLPPVKLQVK